ncbi:MAG: hypothetical protein QF587_00140 [Candidatus Marinimicrobia bacterium]|nr:hypothetical protein [Candidatus Neomarinimicrobiota bacterium]MDP7512138.1 hypothetical protein [Candidatus Neomarinimicrobiota bacterium]
MKRLHNNMVYCLLMFIMFSGNNLQGQSTVLEPEPGFTEYATYYISSFDLQTGASNFQLFRFRLHSDNYPVYSKILFNASMISPALGIDSQTIIVELETGPIQMNADIILDNQDMSTTTTQLIDVSGNSVPLTISINDMIDPAQFDQILSSVITTGRLADGTYTFEVQVYSGSSEDNLTLTDSETINIVVESPSYISLESPGGALEDTSLTEIYSTYPLFIWSPQICSQCEAEIRVAEYIRGVHSSINEAIEDETMLPFDQSAGWEFVGNVTSFQYPVSNARLLEHDKIYVWQIKISLPTTVGDEESISSINTFKIADIGGSDSTPSGVNPVLQVLGQALSSDQFNSLFGAGGSLEEFTPTANITINGTAATESDIMYLINQVINQNASITNITVEE